MKAPLRILLPILAALLVAAGVLLLVWWQLTQSSDRLKRQLQSGDRDPVIGIAGASDPVSDTGDQVLLHLRQGDVLALQGDWATAEKEYRQSADLGGGIPALRKLAQAQMQRREIEEVKKTIEQLRALGAKDDDLLLLQVIVQLRTGELVKAQAALAAAADSPQKHYGLALAAVIQGDHETAKTELQATAGGWDPTLRAYARTLQSAYDEFALFPQSRPIHLTTLLARALAQAQECELALPLLTQVVREQDDYRDAWIVQGYCDLTTERFQEALASFERAYALDPEKPEIQYFLGRAYGALKDHKNAVTFLQYALQNGFQPEREVRRRLAESAIEAGDPSLAFDQYAAISTLSDAEIDVFERGVTLGIAIGRKQEASDLAGKAAQKWKDSAKAYELVGWTLQELDRKDEARTALQKAIELDPGLQSARDRLGKL